MNMAEAIAVCVFLVGPFIIAITIGAVILEVILPAIERRAKKK